MFFLGWPRLSVPRPAVPGHGGPLDPAAFHCHEQPGYFTSSSDSSPRRIHRLTLLLTSYGPCYAPGNVCRFATLINFHSPFSTRCTVASRPSVAAALPASSRCSQAQNALALAPTGDSAGSLPKKLADCLSPQPYRRPRTFLAANDMDLVHRLHELVLIPEPLDTPPCKGLQLASPDLLPVPLCERKWRAWNYVTFWFADAFNLTVRGDRLVSTFGGLPGAADVPNCLVDDCAGAQLVAGLAGRHVRILDRSWISRPQRDSRRAPSHRLCRLCPLRLRTRWLVLARLPACR